MRALVIYESMFGNTQSIAIAIGQGLATHGVVDVVEVGTADRRIGPGVDVLLIGGPTHVFGLSRPSTRADAAKQLGSEPVSHVRGIREWLGETGGGIPGTYAAAFDTKIDKRFVTGSAAHRADKRLRDLHFKIVDDPQNFYVSDIHGPLREGELDRARAWGDRIGTLVTQAALARGDRANSIARSTT